MLHGWECNQLPQAWRKVMTAYRQVDDLWSPVGRLSVHWEAQRLVAFILIFSVLCTFVCMCICVAV